MRSSSAALILLSTICPKHSGRIEHHNARSGINFRVILSSCISLVPIFNSLPENPESHSGFPTLFWVAAQSWRLGSVDSLKSRALCLAWVIIIAQVAVGQVAVTFGFILFYLKKYYLLWWFDYLFHQMQNSNMLLRMCLFFLYLHFVALPGQTQSGWQLNKEKKGLRV